jgi:pimeloyl-ACP methyl ester carboxylesterase
MKNKKFYSSTHKANLVYSVFGSTSKHNSLIVCIPGGPGISKKYMIPFAKLIAAKTKQQVILVDLPNHDKSTKFPINIRYIDVIRILRKFIESLSNNKITLLGHSFGAQIAIDLANKNSLNVHKMILINHPGNKGINLHTKKLIGKNYSKKITTEKQFSAYWRSILPYYFYLPKNAHFKLLKSKTSWIKNSKLQKVQKPWSYYYKNNNNFNYLHKNFILTSNDLFSWGDEKNLFKKLGYTNVYMLKNAGHFPMIEKPTDLLKIVRKVLAKAT